ncbi:MAG: DUF1911 domain-containing protein [Oscillospiraceae bacterium]|jgi:hypothetical protein|nr:DUF1911 domain-containing protein [Oscillospiraceae bacterium]
MLRDSRKDEAYFRQYILNQDARINKFHAIAEKKAENGDKIAAAKAYLFTAGFLKDKLIAAYSAGTPIVDVKAIYEQWVSDCAKASALTYGDLLDMASLAVLLKPTGDVLAAIIRLLSEFSENDILLEGLRNYIKGKEFVYSSGTIKFENYSGLRKVFESADKSAQIERLAEYISEEWYGAQSESPWYNSHLSNNGTYVGYWSFECAALAIALSLDVTKIKHIEFIPAELL